MIKPKSKEQQPSERADYKSLDMDKNFAFTVNSVISAKETIDDATSNVKQTNLYFTLHLYKKLTLRICKPLLLVKLALFFWFAGSFGLTAYFSVFLKQRGLSLAHMSLITGASVVFQLLGTSLSGVLSDKIGRVKPVQFAHIAICISVYFTFLFLPPLTSDSTMPHYQLSITKSGYFPRLITEAWCNTSEIPFQNRTCKLYYFTNTSYTSNDEHCIPLTSIENNLSSQTPFYANSTEIFENAELCCQYEGSPSANTSHTFCDPTFCERLGDECKHNSDGKCFNCNIKSTLLFIVYVILITLHYSSLLSVHRLYDLIVISITEDLKADFGRQRVFSILGSLTGPSVIGYTMQATSSGNDKNYSLAFVFCILFMVLSFLSCWKIEVRKKQPGQRMWRKTIALLKNPDILAVILILLVMGTGFNFVIVYANWYLEDLGASEMLIGMVYPLSNVFALLFLFTSKWWVKKLGVHNVFILALLGHAFFGISYSFLNEPWFAIFIGTATYIFSYHLFWVAVMQHAHNIAPEGLCSTVIVMAGVLHFVVSKVASTLIGGIIMDAYGGRIAFRVIGSINFATAVLYGSFHYSRRFCLQKL